MDSIYKVFAIISSIVMISVFLILWIRSKEKFLHGLMFVLGAWVTFVLGSRIYHYAVNKVLYEAGTYGLFSFELSGFSLYGGLIGVFLYTILWCGLGKLNFWRLSDQLCGAFGLGFITMRMGCYFSGCCFGKPFEGAWGKTYGFLSFSHVIQHQKYNNLFPLQVHPTQLYEILFTVIAMSLGLWVWKKNHQAGNYAFTFSFVFTMGRFINLYFREPLPNSHYHRNMVYLYPIILISIAMIAFLKIRLGTNKQIEIDA